MISTFEFKHTDWTWFLLCIYSKYLLVRILIYFRRITGFRNKFLEFTFPLIYRFLTIGGAVRGAKGCNSQVEEDSVKQEMAMSCSRARWCWRQHHEQEATTEPQQCVDGDPSCSSSETTPMHQERSECNNRSSSGCWGTLERGMNRGEAKSRAFPPIFFKLPVDASSQPPIFPLENVLSIPFSPFFPKLKDCYLYLSFFFSLSFLIWIIFQTKFIKHFTL